MQDRGPALLAVSITFLVLTWITVSLRFYVRVFISNSCGGDDWIMLVALLLFTVFSALTITGVHYGNGQHFTDLYLPDAQKALKIWFIGELIYVISTGFARVSVAIFLLRITVKKCHQIVLWTTTAIIVVMTAFFFFYTLLQCDPVPYFWTRITNPFVPGGKGHCVSTDKLVKATYAVTVIAAAGDLVYALTPVAMLWSANLDKRTKVVVALILGLGAASGAAALVRLAYVGTLNDMSDFLYQTVDLAIWSIIEPGLGVTAGSLATLRPLVRRCQEKWRSRHGTDSTGSQRWKISRITSSNDPADRPWTSDQVAINLGEDYDNFDREGTLNRYGIVVSRDGLRMNPRGEDQEVEEAIRTPWVHRRGSSDLSQRDEWANQAGYGNKF